MRPTVTRHYFRNPEEIYDTARQIGSCFPNASQIIIGIHELLLNAVEHGNLRMDKSLKSSLLLNGTFSQELAARMALPENAHKYIETEWNEGAHCNYLSIRDHGNGFNWKEHLFSQPDASKIHGRGLLIARQCGFDSLVFNDEGNIVTCIARMKMRLHAAKQPLAEVMAW